MRVQLKPGNWGETSLLSDEICMDHHPRVSETETLAECHETAPEVRDGFRSNCAAEDNSVSRVPVVKQCGPACSNPIQRLPVGYSSHRAKDCSRPFRKAIIPNELKVRASHGMNEGARHWESPRVMEEPILK